MWVQSNENTNAFHSQIILFSFCAKWQVNGIGAKGANALCESLKVNTTLTELNLRGKHKPIFITKACMRTPLYGLTDNCIDDVGAQSLGYALKKNTVLIELDLAGWLKQTKARTLNSVFHVALSLWHTNAKQGTRLGEQEQLYCLNLSTQACHSSISFFDQQSLTYNSSKCVSLWVDEHQPCINYLLMTCLRVFSWNNSLFFGCQIKCNEQ